jgi:hypothetical protein
MAMSLTARAGHSGDDHDLDDLSRLNLHQLAGGITRCIEAADGLNVGITYRHAGSCLEGALP